MYRVIYQNRRDISFLDCKNNELCHLELSKKCVLPDDIIDTTGHILTPSPYRHPCYKIAGVMKLNDSVFYGRYNKKLLYRCVPFDKNLPVFYVPYKPKYDFSKVYDDMFVLFRFEDFQEKPVGILTEVIGSVRLLQNYFLYELHARKLWLPRMKWTWNDDMEMSLRSLQQKIRTDRSNTHNVFTIDPAHCTDFDDAFSIRNNIISVYISNVPVILDTLGFRNDIANNVSSIYLPDYTQHMLPKELTQSTCSLRSDGNKKLVFYMDIHSNETIDFGLCWIKVSKNFVYEEDCLQKNESYKTLLSYAQDKSSTSILDSHDLVEFFMVFMNHECSMVLNDGIYRTTTQAHEQHKFYEFFGTYSLEKSVHEALHLQCYGHFTSPIRRMVDIVNLTLLQKHFNFYTFHKDTLSHCETWKLRIDDINSIFHKIRRVEQNCFWLHQFDEYYKAGHSFAPLQKGKVIQKTCIGSGNYEYVIFLLKERKMKTVKSCVTCYSVGEIVNCELLYFENEDNMKKKIRLQIKSA